MEVVYYLLGFAVLILMMVLPFILAAILLALLLLGSLRVASRYKRERRVDIPGVAIILVGILAGAITYQWLQGPKAEMATLQPLVVDRELAAKLPRTWVVDYGAVNVAFDLLPRKYASRVLNARITDPSLLASIRGESYDAFMEEISLVDTPSCNAVIASRHRNAARAQECMMHSIVAKADLAAGGPYLKLEHEEKGDAQIVNFMLVTDAGARPIARCMGQAPREANPWLAMVRRDRSLDVASSIYKCIRRAAAGALILAIATGAAG
ncbi:hypothetical protein ACQKOH_03995 [Sphingomonas sp. NPDC092331]|jgi:hypothetical protein|uniref:hypothetical protein n=1 Tax=unclassified Sphingomonas TaxID=196159 RepID=UPI0031F59A74